MGSYCIAGVKPVIRMPMKSKRKCSTCSKRYYTGTRGECPICSHYRSISKEAFRDYSSNNFEEPKEEAHVGFKPEELVECAVCKELWAPRRSGRNVCSPLCGEYQDRYGWGK